MTRYVGFATGDAFVLDESDDKIVVERLGGEQSPPLRFSWGDVSPQSATLAREILKHALHDDVGKAIKLHRRFLHRAIMSLPKGESWSMSLNDVLDVVTQITDVEKETEGARRDMAREIPKVLDGRLTRDQKWTNNPELTRNNPDNARRR